MRRSLVSPKALLPPHHEINVDDGETPSTSIQPPIELSILHRWLEPCLLLIVGDIQLNLICQLEVATLDRIPTNPLEDYAAARTR